MLLEVKTPVTLTSGLVNKGRYRVDFGILVTFCFLIWVLVKCSVVKKKKIPSYCILNDLCMSMLIAIKVST